MTYRRARLAPDFVERAVLGSLNWNLLADLRVSNISSMDDDHHDDDDGLLFDDDDDDDDAEDHERKCAC